MSVMAAQEARRPAEWERLPAAILDALPTLVDLLANPLDADLWMPLAACRGMDQSVFYPEGYGQGRRTAEARAVCGWCPVRLECTAAAVAAREECGIWGGLNERQLRAVAAAVAATAVVDPACCPAGHPWVDVARALADGGRECRVCFPRRRRR